MPPDLRKGGRVEQSNFDSYQMLRMNEVHIIPSTEAPGGIGETGTSAVPAALTKRDLRGYWQKVAKAADRSRRAEAIGMSRYILQLTGCRSPISVGISSDMVGWIGTARCKTV